MSALLYDEAPATGDCFRLACKHAFHTECIVTALRASGAACPVCRDGGAPIPTMQFELQNDPEEEEEEIEVFSDERMRVVRLRPAVTADRVRLKQAKRNYNVLRDRLRRERRMVIREALERFRRRRYADFLGAKERVRGALEAMKENEIETFKTLYGAEEYENAPWREAHAAVGVNMVLMENSGWNFSTRHHDPMRRTFWYV